jgi:glycosyltransferase involved in cell wall biosynthesis
VQTLHTAKALLALGCSVRLLCVFEAEPPVVQWFARLGISIDCLGLTKPHSYFAILKEVTGRIRALKPDAVHVQYIAPGLLSVLAARLAGIRRVVVTNHQLGTSCTNLEHFLFRCATRLASVTICVSEAAARSWFTPEKSFRLLPSPGRHAVAYNCVDAGPGSERPARESSEGCTIGYVGRIRREKGVDVLIRAFASLAGTFPKARLVIVGDGPQKGECQQLTAALGVADRIGWRAFAAPDLLEEIYQNFDVLAVPSRLEGFGLVAAEAMAYGVPVVAARTGGLPEIVQHHESGLLCAADDPADLAACLETLISYPALRANLGAEGRRRVRERFSPEAYTARIAECYRLLPC